MNEIISNCVLFFLDGNRPDRCFAAGATDDPKSVLAVIALGQISAEMRDFASARNHYEEALKLEPNGQYTKTAKEALRKLKRK